MQKSNVRLTLGHSCVDVYQGAVPALVPFLVLERQYGYVAVSGVVLAATLLSSVVQPLFGVLADRYRMTWLIPVATTAAGLGVALAGPAGSYPLTWLAIALSGLGVAAYHPEAARLMRTVSGGDHVAMSWFSVGGNAGFALAPLIVAPLLSTGGLAATPWLVVPALAGAVISGSVLRSAARAGAGTRGTTGRGRDDWPMFLRLTAIVLIRSIVYIGLSSFAGLWIQQQVGGGAVAGAAALFVLFAGGAVGTLLGGRLVARWGRVPTLRTAYAASVPAVAGVVFVPGPAAYLFVAASSILLYIPFSLHVTLGQDYLPNRVGTAGGVTLGLAVGVGGIATPAIGAIAEATSLQVALAVLIALPVLAFLLARTLREPASLESAGPESAGPVSASASPPGTEPRTDR
ncbi:MFS transporter [Saccharopolyspora taberi]|uniref:MFS transporter n=1 Tax=Saccharopolyspora taberi TaxID=60895 RepID=A0ABN3V5J1_9PSEU